MSPGRQRWTLIAACFAQFMILLDVTIVNVALPSIQRGLDMTAGSLVWTINAYVLPLASLILVGGTLGDRYGRKRVFALGFALFTLFSAGCALSTSDHLLLAFRALQGVGAALLARSRSRSWSTPSSPRGAPGRSGSGRPSPASGSASAPCSGAC